jgi:hypothetical protein
MDMHAVPPPPLPPETAAATLCLLLMLDRVSESRAGAPYFTRHSLKLGFHQTLYLRLAVTALFSKEIATYLPHSYGVLPEALAWCWDSLGITHVPSLPLSMLNPPAISPRKPLELASSQVQWLDCQQRVVTAGVTLESVAFTNGNICLSPTDQEEGASREGVGE